MTEAADLERRRLLLIEDSPSDAMLLEIQLRESVLAAALVERQESLSSGLRRLKEESFDAVLVDLGLPDSDGLVTFTQVAAVAGEAAVVVVTGQDDARMAEDAVRLGAQDYLVKTVARQGELGHAVDNAIRRQKVLLELQRVREEQLAAKDHFLSHVSHELRAPLSVVHQFGSLLMDGVAGGMTTEQQELLEVLMRNVGQLKRMIDDLLDATRVRRDLLSVVCRDVPLSRLLRDVVAGYTPEAARLGVALAAEAVGGTTVHADPERLREIVSNVIGNSLKFTSRGGSVSVSARTERGMAHVTVRDDGRGIPPELLERCFEQFFQVDHEDVSRNGLGLGLYVCRALVERQGGSMWAESRLGSGTCMHFTVPLEVGPAPLEALP